MGVEVTRYSYVDDNEGGNYRAAIHIVIPLTGIRKPYTELPAWRQKRRDKNKLFLA